MADDVTGGSGGEGDGWTEVPRVNHLSELNEDSECTEASLGHNYTWLLIIVAWTTHIVVV